MNFRGSKIGQPVLSAFFLLVLAFPIAVKTIHISGSNKHVVCHDHTLHFHEEYHECTICDFYFAPYDLVPDSPVLSGFEDLYVKSVYSDRTDYDFSGYIFFQLRAPPYHS